MPPFFFFLLFLRPSVEDQKWAQDAPVDGLNPDWQTSDGPLFFDSFPERLERNRHAVKRADAYFQNGPG